MPNWPAFQRDLQHLINAHSLENGSNTPDHLLAEYLIHCLQGFNTTVGMREIWYGRRELIMDTHLPENQSPSHPGCGTPGCPSVVCGCPL